MALELHTDQSSTPTMTRGEDSLLQSLFANLLDNALDASPKGGEVAVIMSQDQDSVRIAIHNQGIVAEEVRDRFFEKYATCGKIKGTGLGTYSAMLIAKAHGGDVVMESGETSGTTVTVTLPREEPEEEG